MMESVRLLQNGFASLDIIREAAVAADVPERKNMREIEETLGGELGEENVDAQKDISNNCAENRRTDEMLNSFSN